MAFTASELVTLSDISGLDPVALNNWLAGITITTETEDAIQADIVYWNSNLALAAGLSIEATESNYGAVLNGNDIRAAIIARTRRRLQMEMPSYEGIGTIQIGL